MRAALVAIALLVAPALAQDKPALAPGEIVAAAPASDWVAIAPADLLVMDLAPLAQDTQRRVVIQLMPPPFSQGWTDNIRKLAAAKYWDGTSVNRVQDNYVVQWGDATEKKPLPPGLATVLASQYEIAGPAFYQATKNLGGGPKQPAAATAVGEALENLLAEADRAESEGRILRTGDRDAYAPISDLAAGWWFAGDGRSYWPVHCYGMVGVGRNLAPDTGSGAELYTVIGHAPRHLDRNIAVVGRVIEGIEHLSSLPRGTEALGFYKTAEERVPIVSVRLASDLPGVPRYQYLSTESETFARYAEARANRRDPFFNVPAGGADICNIPVPVRRTP